MKRLLLCANPSASGFTGGRHRAVISELSRHFEVVNEWPQTAADTRAAAAAAAAAGYDLVVAMGGDGVVHHAAHGVGGTPTALGIIPAGTANVFARVLGIPTRPERAAEAICAQPRPRPMTAGVLTLDHAPGRVESRVAAFATGMGFDAEAVRRAEREPYRKYRFGHLHYARAALGAIWEGYAGRPPRLRVRAPDREAEAVAALVQLRDRYTFFGRMPLRLGNRAPETATVAVFRTLPRRRIGAVLARAAARRDLDRIAGIEIWEGVTSLTITRLADPPEADPGTRPADEDAPPPAQADGELLGTPRKLSLAVQPGYLRVISPAR